MPFPTAALGAASCSARRRCFFLLAGKTIRSDSLQLNGKEINPKMLKKDTEKPDCAKDFTLTKVS